MSEELNKNEINTIGAYVQLKMATEIQDGRQFQAFFFALCLITCISEPSLVSLVSIHWYACDSN